MNDNFEAVLYTKNGINEYAATPNEKVAKEMTGWKRVEETVKKAKPARKSRTLKKIEETNQEETNNG